MTLSAPKQWTFYVAVILWLLGLIGFWVEGIDKLFLSEGGFAFWLAIIGGLILILGNLLEGL